MLSDRHIIAFHSTTSVSWNVLFAIQSGMANVKNHNVVSHDGRHGPHNMRGAIEADQVWEHFVSKGKNGT